MKSAERVNKERRIDPHGVYGRMDVMRLLQMEKRGLVRAVREQGLRHAQLGHRYCFLGSWILAWLESVSIQRGAVPEQNGEGEGCLS